LIGADKWCYPNPLDSVSSWCKLYF
jgi:hypothetical protein